MGRRGWDGGKHWSPGIQPIPPYQIPQAPKRYFAIFPPNIDWSIIGNWTINVYYDILNPINSQIYIIIPPNIGWPIFGENIGQ